MTAQSGARVGWVWFLLTWGGLAWAEEGSTPRGQPLDMGVEAFQWEEFQDGRRLLRERGTRFLVGLSRDNRTRRWPGWVYRARARGFVGRVDYQGHSQDLSGVSYPLATVTDYLGAEARLLVGQRLGYLPGGQVLDLYVGLEGRLWLRDIHSGVDAGGRYAQGYREVYRLLSGQFALGLGRLNGGGSWFTVGLSWPWRVSEWVSLSGTTLRPRGRLGGWMDFRLPLSASAWFGLEVSWLDLAASPPVDGYLQPDSRALRVAGVLSWSW